jgi:hypothetical protein
VRIILEELIKVAIPNGIFAVLFVFLLWWILNENSKREGRYQTTIDKLADKLDIIDLIQKDVTEIKIKIDQK